MSRKISSSRAVSSVELLGRVRARDAHELLDHALGDRRREQGVSGGDRPHRGDQLLGGVVLEHEAAGPDAQRLVDVLVQVERREDQDARVGVGREDAPRRLEPVELGHADVHQHDRGMEARGLADRVEPVAGLGHHLDVLLSRQQHAKAGADHGLVVDHEDPDHARSPPTGRRARSTKPPRLPAPAVISPP